MRADIAEFPGGMSDVGQRVHDLSQRVIRAETILEEHSPRRAEQADIAISAHDLDATSSQAQQPVDALVRGDKQGETAGRVGGVVTEPLLLGRHTLG